MATTNRLDTAFATDFKPTGTATAQIDVRPGGSTPTEQNYVLYFDDTTVEYADLNIRLPANYSGGGLTLSIEWLSASATTGDVVWQAAVRRIADDAEDLDTSQTYDYNLSSAKTTASASGETVKSTITFTSGADMDSWAVDESAILRIARLPTDGGDTMVGDAGIWSVVINET
jgi:hypothetical protein